MLQQTTSATKDRSAVGRFVKGRRRDAQDEIEAWITDTTSEFGRGTSSRVSAQPPKNITEQKMLESKLFEMSKQRYNFMLHSRWQQKLFMEKQRQKTAVMKDLLKNVDLSKLQSVSGSRKDSRMTLSSIRSERFNRIAQADSTRTVADQTLSPATTLTVTDTARKKVVTFVTERNNISTAFSHSSSLPISVVQSVNLPEMEHPSLRAAKDGLPNLFSTHGRRKGYLLPLEGRWPVKDARFIKLSQALSENYPASRRREASVSLA